MLSILCVSRNEAHAKDAIEVFAIYAQLMKAELAIVFDRPERSTEYAYTIADKVMELESKGYIESVLDGAIDYCSGDWVLRLDDDEHLSRSLEEWMVSGEYLHAGGDIFAFPRMNMWKDNFYITNAPLFPDYQTRLSVKTKAGGRQEIHQGSPHGTGKIIPHAIIHNKFLVRSYEQRKAIANNYENMKPGCGSGHYLAFSLPEDAFNMLNLAHNESGDFSK